MLGVQNGVINLEAGEFRAARREDYIVKRAAIGYDPKATCPQWRKFLARILPEDMVPYVQRVVGYTLTGFTGEEILFVLWGDGANGKSTFRDTIFTMLGDYAMASDANLLVMPKRGEGARATPEVARLNGKRLVTVNETQDGDVLNESRVKFITGQDVINARSLFQEPFDFWPTHKGFITTQHKPIIKGVDEGIWRRIHLWPFEYMFPEKERDPHFRQDVLTPELPGILNWALAGLRDYQNGGLQPPKTVTAATKDYRADMDLVGQWITERCVIDPEGKPKGADLYEDYKNWSINEVGFSKNPIGFGRDLSKRFTRTTFNNVRCYQGLKLKYGIQSRTENQGAE